VKTTENSLKVHNTFTRLDGSVSRNCARQRSRIHPCTNHDRHT